MNSLVDVDRLAASASSGLGDGVGAVAVRFGGVRRVLAHGCSGGC